MVTFYALDSCLRLEPLFVCKFTPSIKWKLACRPQLPSLPLSTLTNICTHINFHSFAALLYQRYRAFLEIFTPAFENIMATERWQVFILFFVFFCLPNSFEVVWLEPYVFILSICPLNVIKKDFVKRDFLIQSVPSLTVG